MSDLKGTIRFRGQRLYRRLVLTSGTSATYTKPRNVRCLDVTAIGPGGGGGGSDGASSNAGAGGGGGGGEYRRLLITNPAESYTYTVGQGGTGGTAGNNAGTNGTASTSFTDGAVTITADYGRGGASMAAGTAAGTAAGGGAGGSGGSGGDFAVGGQKGGTGYRQSGTVSFGGEGASTPLGMGGALIRTPGAGNNATGYGAGGGGAASAGVTDYAGGNGANGVIIIDEYE